MRLVSEPYSTQVARWPRTGRHILGQFTDDAVVVYQAYRPKIGRLAAQYKQFGGEFSLSRMSWIKPNFLWMMYRSRWGTKENQEVTLAVWLRRAAFDEILQQAVPSTFVPTVYPDECAWKRAVQHSAVRLQWDPDHTPTGGAVERRAIQLGLRGAVLARYAHDWIIDIEDISDFVSEQRPRAQAREYADLVTPREAVYPVHDRETAAHLALSPLDSV
jgi:hypothetical protein